MALIIHEKFSKFRHIIQTLYRKDDTFRGIYDDYQTYLKALQFWEQSNAEDAPARQYEYSDLVHELEIELIEIMEKRR
jgi:TRAP-type mannitol/chloroaromatic compound transport system substrate-binding protein